MFLPARMTRLVLGGHKDHMPGVIEVLHHEGLVHLEDYLDPAEVTEIGTPLDEGDRVSALLLRARGLMKSLEVRGQPERGMVPSDAGAVLKEVEAAVQPVLEEEAQIRSELGQIESSVGALRPFAPLDVELDLLESLSSVKGYMGTVREDPSPRLREAGVPCEVVRDPAGRAPVVALFVPVGDAEPAERVLSECGFSSAALPPGLAGRPAEALRRLGARRAELEGRLGGLEGRRLALAGEWGPRLAALENHLAAEADKTQAPLRFRVTETTFHAEGWVPRRLAVRAREGLAERFGDSVYVEDLGDGPRSADLHGDAGHGHHEDDPADEAPVKLENPRAARPFEFLLGLLGRPRYKEVDPTKLMLVFFPLFFGIIVGDMAVGLVIMGIGFLLKTRYVFGIGGPAVGRALIYGGLVATLIGLVVFGEAFGIHFVESEENLEKGKLSWEHVFGADWSDNRFIYKTGGEGYGDAADPEGMTVLAEGSERAGLVGVLAPGDHAHLSVNGWFNLGYYHKIDDIMALLVWSLLIGIVHIVLGLLIGARNVWVAHGAALAVQEKLAWLTLLAAVGVVVAGFLTASNALLVVGGAVAAASVVLLYIGAQKVLGVGFIAFLEIPGLMGNILSYTRLAALGASKAGMVIAFTTIGFTVLGGGFVGWLVYGLGLVLIIGLSVLAGSLQSLRLQFVEFFQKFYVGGGRTYVPFGRRAP